MIRLLCLVAALVAAGIPVRAQTLQPPYPHDSSEPSEEPPSSEVVFLPNYHFHLNIAHLSGDDPQFVWDSNFGGELGIIAYRNTQLTFVANYQAILGEEFQPFDPNQGNYTVAGVMAVRLGHVEVAGVLHHLSRHLGDRPKDDFPVDWNMVGGRVAAHGRRGRAQLDAQLDLRGSILKTNVDYDWELIATTQARFRLRPAIELLGGGGVRHVGVNGSRNRGGQTGGRGEGGIRFNGRSGAVDFFLAVERVIDPYPLAVGRVTWASFGMRLLSR